MTLPAELGELSPARQAFLDAREVIDGWRPACDDARPAIDFRAPPAAARPPAPTAAPTPSRSAVVGGGRAARDLWAGRVTCLGLVEEALAAVERHDADLNAMVELLADSARAEAVVLDAELAAGAPRGPLHGVPFTVKDVVDVAGVPTRAGSAVWSRLPCADAVAVARLRDAGPSCSARSRPTSSPWA